MHRHTLISKNRTRSVLGGSLLFLRLSKTPLALLFPSLTLLLKDESCRYVSKGLTTIFLFCPFSLWFIVWKSTRRSYPSIYTQVCIWKSCSEKGKKKITETLRVRKWNLAVGSESVPLGRRLVTFLWICFLWDWWGRWCFWEHGGTGGEGGCACWQGELTGHEESGGVLDHSITSYPQQSQKPLWE